LYSDKKKIQFTVDLCYVISLLKYIYKIAQKNVAHGVVDSKLFAGSGGSGTRGYGSESRSTTGLKPYQYHQIYLHFGSYDIMI
jgi:hypothetical protein